MPYIWPYRVEGLNSGPIRTCVEFSGDFEQIIENILNLIIVAL